MPSKGEAREPATPEPGRTRGKIRRLLPGSNTKQGYYSYFSYVWRPLGHPQPRRVWVIKGGPGTGKSAFMKRAAEAALERGYDVELHHCAADPDSIDGFVVPALGAAVVDGTAPHQVDPLYPGVVEELVNLGDYWDGPGLRRHDRRVLEVTARYKELYAAAYRYLAAAAVVHDEWRAARGEAQDWARVQEIRWRVLADLLRGRTAGSGGWVRKLFGSAITPDGCRTFLPGEAVAVSRIIVLAGEPGTGKSFLVRTWAEALAEHGYALELFHCGLHPQEPEHLRVPELGLLVLSSEEPHLFGEGAGGNRGGYPLEAARLEIIDLGRFQKEEARRYKESRAEGARKAFWTLLEQGMRLLREARDLHDELESLYGAHMDFEAVEQRRQRLVEELLALESYVSSGP